MPPQEQRTVFQRRKKLYMPFSVFTSRYTHEIVRVSTTLIPPSMMFAIR